LCPLNLDPSRVRVLLATGDVNPARHTDVIIRSRKDDFSYPFAATKDILRAADLTVINLEAPLIKGCPSRGPRFQFCGRPGFAKALKEAGVDVVTLENNHIGNYGRSAIVETIRHLEGSGLAWADRERPAVLEVRGLRFGFLTFNGVGEAIDRPKMMARIQALRPQVDLVVIAFHWGAEYVHLPQAGPGIAPDDPIEIAHLAVEAGADLILGNHPHQVQAVEIYRGKLIAYAHGNFIFDQMWSYGTRVGVLGRYTFHDRILVKAEYLPIRIENYAQPVPLQGEEAVAVLDQMREASEELARKVAAAPARANGRSHP
jgi:poly-gamma-glutamate synthesis protein (capsule biosynthesis protein)